MRYARYSFYTDPQSGQKTLPAQVDGVCFLSNDESELVGYLNIDAEVSLLTDWSLTEITQSEFFDLLLLRNPEVIIINDKAVFPLLELV